MTRDITPAGSPATGALDGAFAEGIGEMIERSLNAKVALEFVTHGLEWSVSIPATNLVIEAQTGTETRP